AGKKTAKRKRSNEGEAGKEDVQAKLAKFDGEDKKVELLDLSSDLLTCIIHKMPVKDRLKLGATCNFLYKLENEAGGKRLDELWMNSNEIGRFMVCEKEEVIGEIIDCSRRGM
ncbi:hypothetical protein PFISCL1PPCAC_21876, partial [Pristionchus fissidentatus]